MIIDEGSALGAADDDGSALGSALGAADDDTSALGSALGAADDDGSALGSALGAADDDGSALGIDDVDGRGVFDCEILDVLVLLDVTDRVGLADGVN